MARVTIDSGPITWEDHARDVNKEDWPRLMSERRLHLSTKITYPCRILIRCLREAEIMYEYLGYESPDDMILQGYEFDPEEIRLAVEWLKHKDPEELVNLPEVIEQVRGARAEKAQRLAEEIQEPVKDTGRPKKVDEKENHPPLPKGGTSAPRAIARLRETHPEIATRLEQGEFPSVAAAVRVSRGEPMTPPRKKATDLEILQRVWMRTSIEEREALARGEIGAEIERLRKEDRS